jgi:hypothetical protein
VWVRVLWVRRIVSSLESAWHTHTHKGGGEWPKGRQSLTAERLWRRSRMGQKTAEGHQHETSVESMPNPENIPRTPSDAVVQIYRTSTITVQ